MIRRSALLLTVLAITLAGCTPTPAATSTPSASETESSTPTPTPTQQQQLDLPDDAVLGITAHATADTGAEVDITLVLLKPEAWDTPNGTARGDATQAWCEGEVDDDVFTAQGGFSFGQLDVTVTPTEGSAPWPTDLPLHILPGGGGGPTIATGGAAYSVEKPDDSGSDDPGYYVPHCAQDAFLDVPGSGEVYLGWGDDGSSLAAWAFGNYGVTFDLFGESTDDRVTLSDCAKVITQLGESMGGSDATLPDNFSATQCRVGSSA